MLDRPTDYAAELREMKRRIRQLETRNPFASASITRGSGVRIALPAGIRLEGDGSITAGGLVFSAAGNGTIQAGGAFIRGSGGGQVGAGGTLIGGDGRISSTSGTNRFNGNVAADGGISAASASFAGALGALSAYITGSLNSGGLYARGDIATEGIITERGRDLGYATDAARFVADDAWARSNSAEAAANAAQATANGRVTQQQLQDMATGISRIVANIASIISRVNEHQQWWEQAGKPSRPPLVQG